MRARVKEQFAGVRTIWREQRTVREKTVALYHFITALHVQEELERWRMRLEEEGRLALAREYAQMYRIVMDLLDKLVQLLAEEQMELAEYEKVLEAGFLASAVGVISLDSAGL